MKKKKKGIALIKKSNDLIDAKYKFNLWEMRIFLSILAKIHKDDQDFAAYKIWYKDVIKDFGLKSAESYNYLREAGNSMLEQKLYTHYLSDGVKRDVTYNIFGKVDTLSKEGQSVLTDFSKQGYIEITVHPDMKPFLLQLQKNFTAYDMRYVLKLGVYSLRIYELLKQYETFKNRKIDVDEMKEMFTLKTEYPLFANFYQRIVDPGVREINEYSDIYIERVEKVKEGRKVTALHFFFRPKTAAELVVVLKNIGIVVEPMTLFNTAQNEFQMPNFQNDSIEVIDAEIIKEEPKNELQDELFLRYNSIVVQQFGVSPSVFFSEVGKYDTETIEKAIRVTQQTAKEGKVKNLSGFFIEALRKGYTNQAEEKAIVKAARATEVLKQKVQRAQLEEDLAHLVGTIRYEENSTIRQIIAYDETNRFKAIDQAKIIISKNIYYKNKVAEKSYDLETLDIKIWREDELLREIVQDGFKILFAKEFEYLKPMRDKMDRLKKYIKAIV